MTEEGDGTTVLRQKFESISISLDVAGPANVDDEIAAIHKQVKSIAEKRLFDWKSAELSVPTFSEAAPFCSGEIPLFQLEEDTDAELLNLALDEHGQRKSLNSKQLKEIWEDATFRVDSKKFEGLQHRWKASMLLLSGQEAIRKNLQKYFSFSLREFVETIPNYLYYNKNLSIYFGCRWIMTIIADALRLIVSSPAKKKLEDYEIANIINVLKQYSILNGFFDFVKTKLPICETGGVYYFNCHPYFQSKEGQLMLRQIKQASKLPEDAILQDLLCLLHVSEASVLDELKRIHDLSENTIWEQRDFIENELEKEVAELKGEDIENGSVGVSLEIRTLAMNNIKTKIEEQLKQKFCALIMASPVLNGKNERLPGVLVGVFNGLDFLQKMERELEEQLLLKRNEITEQIKKKHPYLSRIPSWRASKIAEEMKVFEEKFVREFKNAAIQKTKQNYPLFHLILQEDRVFSGKTNDLTDILKTYEEPARIFSFKRNIKNPKNWKIQSYVVNEKTVYYAETQKSVDVESSRWFWRYRCTFTRAWVWTWNTVLWLSSAATDGPLGWKALVYTKPFCPYKEVDYETGEIVTNTRKVVYPFTSRLQKLWNHISQSIERFEAKPNLGLLGKSVTRFFHRTWNYFFIGLVGSLSISIGLPTLIFLNLALCTIAMILAVPLCPLMAVGKHLFNILALDLDRASQKPSHSIFYQVVRFFFALVCITVSIGRIISAPVISSVSVLLGSIVYLFRQAYDHITFYTIVRNLAKIPARDHFLCRRIEGPNLSFRLYHQIEHDIAIFCVRSKLENNLLDIYGSQMRNIIDEPTRNYENLINSIIMPYGMAVVQRQPSLESTRVRLSDILNKNLQDESAKRWFPPSLFNVRMTESELLNFVSTAKVLIQTFHERKVFPLLSKTEIKQFWRTRNIPEGDFSSLCQTILSEVFSPEFVLSPLSSTDVSVKIKVHEAAKVHNFVNMIFQNEYRDPMDKISYYGGKKADLNMIVPQFSSYDIYYLQNWLNDGNGIQPIRQASNLSINNALSLYNVANTEKNQRIIKIDNDFYRY